jgi:hypothetical protein
MNRKKNFKQHPKNTKVPQPPEAGDLKFRFFEVTEKECNGDSSKLIKKFVRRTRKEEVLKPFYRKLLYWETKSQKRRSQRLRGIYEHQKAAAKQKLEDEKSFE